MARLEAAGIGLPGARRRWCRSCPAAVVFDLGRGGDFAAPAGRRDRRGRVRRGAATGPVGAGRRRRRHRRGGRRAQGRGGHGERGAGRRGRRRGAGRASTRPARPSTRRTGSCYGARSGLPGEFPAVAVEPGRRSTRCARPAAAAAAGRSARRPRSPWWPPTSRWTRPAAPGWPAMGHDGLARAVVAGAHGDGRRHGVRALHRPPARRRSCAELVALQAAAADVVTRAVVHALLAARDDACTHCRAAGSGAATADVAVGRRRTREVRSGCGRAQPPANGGSTSRVAPSGSGGGPVPHRDLVEQEAAPLAAPGPARRRAGRASAASTSSTVAPAGSSTARPRRRRRRGPRRSTGRSRWSAVMPASAQPPIALIGRSGCRKPGSSMPCPASLPHIACAPGVGDLGVGRAAAQQRPQVGLGAGEQAGADLPVGGEPGAVAGAAERPGHRGDHADHGRAAVHQPALGRGAAALGGVRGEVERRRAAARRISPAVTISVRSQPCWASSGICSMNRSS